MRNSSLKRSGMARVNEGSHSFTCHPRVIHMWNEPYLPLLPSRRASPHFGRYSFSVPLRVGGWVGLNMEPMFQPTTLVVHVEQWVWCVRLCLWVRTTTFELSDQWPRYLTSWFILMPSRSSSKVNVMGQSSKDGKCSLRLWPKTHLMQHSYCNCLHHPYTSGDSDVISSLPYLCQLFSRHFVGQTLRNVCYSVINFTVR